MKALFKVNFEEPKTLVTCGKKRPHQLVRWRAPRRSFWPAKRRADGNLRQMKKKSNVIAEEPRAGGEKVTVSSVKASREKPSLRSRQVAS